MVPTDAKSTGVCDERTINMTLNWEENQVNSNKIIFNYARDDSKFFLDSISVNMHLSNNFSLYITLKFYKNVYTNVTCNTHLFATQLLF